MLDMTLLGMVLLTGPNSMNTKGIVAELREAWHLTVDETEAGDATGVLVVDGYMLTLMLIPAPIPGNEVEELVTNYNPLWDEGLPQVKAHTGHIVLSILNAGKDPVQENLLFTKLACAVLNNSSSIGVYMGTRSLALEKGSYLTVAKPMSENKLPILAWVYFGLREEQGKHSIYTYGLTEFGKKEMEIVESKHSLRELSEMMYDIVHYVLANNVDLKHGQTMGSTTKQKLMIRESKGRYLPDVTLKIGY